MFSRSPRAVTGAVPTTSVRANGDRITFVARLKGAVRSLAHGNFRLFFAGQGISLVGTWMQQLAMTWLVYRLTGSAFWLGMVGFATQIPSFFLAPVAGVLTDRWNRHRLLIATQTLAMLQAFLLAFLAATGKIEVWHLLVLGLCLGVVNAFDMTARQAFLTEMVTRREDLGNAIALNSSMVNGARLVGPSLAGILIAVVHESGCFLLNGVSYLAVIAALLAMRVAPRQHATPHPRLLPGLREGVRYVFGFTPIRSLILLLAVVSLVGLPYTVLMPLFAHDDPRTLGLLMAASGVGALGGAMYLASRQSILGLGKLIALTPCLFGVGLIGFALSQQLGLSLAMLFLTGFAMMVQMAATNTILQTIVDEDKRGRVMSFYTMAFLGMTPIGSLLAGGLAARIGAVATLELGGAGCIIAALFFARRLPLLRQMVRPIYVRMGILPELAAGIQAATELRVPPEQ